ncbi:PKD domain-containing protein [Streptomyces sp. UC4497]
MRAGEPVAFRARVETPPGGGSGVATEWDFAGKGDFDSASFGAPAPLVKVRRTFTYSEPGTYFPVLRAMSQRQEGRLVALRQGDQPRRKRSRSWSLARRRSPAAPASAAPSIPPPRPSRGRRCRPGPGGR